ncbi:MAG TPA: glutaminyl-peptide cyclotransferase, partial [Bryobacteraceae bacterium]|nr:glutaminyl-peptide cyclotransferase [Bryobacteraceae bacterium]
MIIRSSQLGLILFLIQSSGLPAAQTAPRSASRTPIEYTYTVVHVYPHDRTAFTQGLEYHGGFLYEGTGLNGKSSLRKVKLETGEVLERIDLDGEFFGEGITIFGDQIVQVTWQTQTGFVYSLADFHLRRRFTYPGEGWGMANDGRQIFLSDGSDQIRVWDPRTLAERRRIHVHTGTDAVKELNELEYVDGEIYANIWQTDRIARISPASGQVVGWIDLSGLLSPMYRSGS